MDDRHRSIDPRGPARKAVEDAEVRPPAGAKPRSVSAAGHRACHARFRAFPSFPREARAAVHARRGAGIARRFMLPIRLQLTRRLMAPLCARRLARGACAGWGR